MVLVTVHRALAYTKSPVLFAVRVVLQHPILQGADPHQVQQRLPKPLGCHGYPFASSRSSVAMTDEEQWTPSARSFSTCLANQRTAWLGSPPVSC
jgi:hypothetical protein